MEGLITWKRWIVKIHTSFYIGIPREYAELMKLDRDVEVNLEFNQDGSLTLRPVEAKEPVNVK